MSRADPNLAGTFVQTAAKSAVAVPTAAADVFGTQFYRNANFAGGVAGVVDSAIRVQTDVAAGVVDYQWGITSVLNNNAAAGENVALYGQGNRVDNATGPTWSTVAEVIDKSGAADPAVGLVGIEVDVEANGTDANHERHGIYVVAKTHGAGAACTAYAGLRIAPGAGAAVWANGLLIDGQTLLGINFTGTTNVGIDFSTAVSIASAAVRFARQQKISWEPTGTLQQQMAGGSDIVQFLRGGVEKVGLDLQNAAPNVRISGTQVVAARQTGWTAATGTATRTTFATATVLLPALAEHVKALIDDLIVHGLIGA